MTTSEFRTETAKTVFERTYSRTKPDGSKETWGETVARVVDGNLALVPEKYHYEGERQDLIDFMTDFRILPAGRHIKSSGVNDYALNNCWASGWISSEPAEHYTFLFSRLMEGGGVGANYSSRYLKDMPPVVIPVTVHIVCDPSHPDYLDMLEAGLLSAEYAYDWDGAYAVQDSREGWSDALRDLIDTAHDPKTVHRTRVYDVSRVRKKGAPLRKFGGSASGPAPFAQMMRNVGRVLESAGHFLRPLSGLDAMEIDHEIAQCVVSGGVRRSARMAIMHWADEDIFRFIHCKADMAKHWTTNISVETDYEFSDALNNPRHLLHDHAQRVMDEMSAGMHANGEPGFWNSGYSAEGEPDGTYCTNPCGEITLTMWEPCCLGHVNLGAFVDGRRTVDYEGLVKAHRLMTRYLIRATHARVADRKSRHAIDRNRRIGVGHFGFADYLAKLGIPYSDSPFHFGVEMLLTRMAKLVDQEATAYCHQLRIPIPVKRRTIAPTGTVAKLAGSSGEGVHPIFARHFIRRIRFSTVEPGEVKQVEEYRAKGYKVEPCIYAANTMVVQIPTVDPLALDHPDVQSVDEISLRATLDVQELYQKLWADNAVSMTVNLNPDVVKEPDLKEALTEYADLLKGTTIFPEVSRDQAPYERITEEQYAALVAEAGGPADADTGYDEVCASGACPI
ncbi:ribonucleoside-triphosphate reductase, adenosylcobalamin-dependent [Streptomyces sp. NPDC059708]|uniref:ribonucleoside-triphosphate reductase, adenosylcobalamin-dependent n=1 Tax=Streptomyces sp. NPDC059708 TaxID=3346916 RepID=UPI003691C6D6